MDVELGRARKGDRIVGAGALAFFISLFFLSWYGVSSNAPAVVGVDIGGSHTATGWQTFTNSRWLWLVTILVALGALALTVTAREHEAPVAPWPIVTALGALSTIFVLYRIVHHPAVDATIGGFHVTAGIEPGIWLGLVSALTISAGGYLSLRERAAPAAHAPGTDAFTGLLRGGGARDAHGSAPGADRAGGEAPEGATGGPYNSPRDRA
jgi:hypothetical protein